MILYHSLHIELTEGVEDRVSRILGTLRDSLFSLFSLSSRKTISISGKGSVFSNVVILLKVFRGFLSPLHRPTVPLVGTLISQL